MALSNWVIFETGAPAVGIVTAITHPAPITPILGTGSLRIQQFSVTESLINMYRTGYAPSVIKGRFRSVIRCLGAAGITNYSLGFAIMQSQLNLTGGSGSCYFAHLTVQNGGTLAKFIIRKFSGVGLLTNLSASTTLYTGSSLGTVLGTNIAVQVEWDASTIPTQCDITIRYALGTTSFGSLTLETTVSDTTSPLLTSSGESIAVTNGTSSGATDFLVDSTNLVSLL